MNPELIRDMRERSALLDPSDQQPSTIQIQPSVTVHKSLPGLGAWISTHTLPRGSLQSRTVNNVHGQHS